MTTDDTALSLHALIQKLDDELPLVGPDEMPESGLTFFVPGTWESNALRRPPVRSRLAPRVLITIDEPMPLIGFMLAMLCLGATVGAIVFNARLAQLW